MSKHRTQGKHRSKVSPVRTIVVPWRRLCAAIPALALTGGGIVLAGPAATSPALKTVAVAKGSPAIVIPGVAMTIPVVPGQILTKPVAAAAVPKKPALVLPAGTKPGSSTPVVLDGSGVPTRALEGYRTAATLVGAADPGCNIDWALLAAIGRVESNHARFAGNQLDSAGVAQPGIIGIPLDGTNGTARILDSDGGTLDRDTFYDRAVGPMQFIPSTWRAMGADADGDGVKNPQDMADAATASAIYLCSGPGDLRQPGDLRSAILRYNYSDDYVQTVTSIAAAYRQGVTALPASALPVSAPSQPPVPRHAMVVVSPAAGQAAAGPAGANPKPASALTPQPATTSGMPAPLPSTTTVPVPSAPTPVPTTSIPSVTVPATTVPIPTTTTPTTTTPTTTTPTTTTPTTTTPTTTTPATPDACLTPTSTAPAPAPDPTAPATATPCPSPTTGASTVVPASAP
jgi:Transglycosylase SLT domain